LLVTLANLLFLIINYTVTSDNRWYK